MIVSGPTTQVGVRVSDEKDFSSYSTYTLAFRQQCFRHTETTPSP